MESRLSQIVRFRAISHYLSDLFDPLEHEALTNILGSPPIISLNSEMDLGTAIELLHKTYVARRSNSRMHNRYQ